MQSQPNLRGSSDQHLHQLYNGNGVSNLFRHRIGLGGIYGIGPGIGHRISSCGSGFIVATLLVAGANQEAQAKQNAKYCDDSCASHQIVHKPGIEKGIQAVDFLLGKQEVGENVTIIGGGLTGCEIAYELYLQGKKPTIVEMMDDLIVTKGVCLANTSFLRDFFEANEVPVHLETALKEIKDGSVTVAGKDGKTFDIPADSVILSVGYKSAPLAEKSKKVHIVGDAQKVGNLRSVIWGAWDTCMKI